MLIIRQIRLSIKTKLWFAFSFLIACIAIFIYLYFPARFEEQATNALINKVKAIAAMSSYNIAPAMYFNDETNMLEAAKMAVLDNDINCCLIFDNNNKIILDYASKNVKNICDKSYSEKSNFDSSRNLFRSSKNISYNGVNLGKLVLCANTNNLKREVQQSKLTIFIISMIVFIIGFLLIFAISYLISEPIKKISQNMKIIADGDYSMRSVVRTHDEIGMLSDSFNKMATNLEIAYKELYDLNTNLENRVKDRTKELLSEINKRKRAEEVLNESQNKLRKLTIHLESVREEERKLLAEQIHDEIGQALTAVKLDLDWIYDKTSEGQQKIRERIDALIKIVDDTINLIRTISTELRPAIIDDFGLNSAIKWFIDNFAKSTKIKFNFTSNIKDENISNQHKLIVFRIIKEAVTNIIRHSGATNVDIVFEEFFDYFRISIFDDGVGISEEVLKSPNSFGINAMRERVFALGGTIEFLGGMSNGTLVVLNFPKNI